MGKTLMNIEETRKELSNVTNREMIIYILTIIFIVPWAGLGIILLIVYILLKNKSNQVFTTDVNKDNLSSLRYRALLFNVILIILLIHFILLAFTIILIPLTIIYYKYYKGCRKGMRKLEDAGYELESLLRDENDHFPPTQHEIDSRHEV